MLPADSIGKTSLLLCATALLGLHAAGPASAQGTQSCACTAPLSASQTTVGTIVAARGDVLMSLPQGFGVASAGAPLQAGSQVMVGPDGAASLAVGSNCRIEIAAGFDVSLVSVPEGICVAVTEPLTTAQVNEQTKIDPARVAAIGLFAGAAIGVTAIILGSDGDGPASD